MTEKTPIFETVLTGFVPGKAQSAGSKSAIVLHDRAGNVRRNSKGRPMVNVIDSNKHGAAWKAQARASLPRLSPLLEGAIKLTVIFQNIRPMGHFRTGKFTGLLKATAPEWPTVKPDTTKLLRCLEDGLTGHVWRDDAQIVVQHVSKVYGEPGAWIEVGKFVGWEEVKA